ncbi:hypothetical protein J6590_093562 [Homalodisca vitripennis]|nr:hypothetical protein J6590_093562 [Homalodisca vitripennis]
MAIYTILNLFLKTFLTHSESEMLRSGPSVLKGPSGRPYAVVNTPTLVPLSPGTGSGTYHCRYLDQLMYRSNPQKMSTHRV